MASDDITTEKLTRQKSVHCAEPKNINNSHSDHINVHLSMSEHAMAIKLLEVAGNTGDLHEYMRVVTGMLHNWSGCEAVGIRLQEGDDYPYFETRGFEAEFVEAERCLCEIDDNGNTILDETGNPVLECMCGNIIRGCFDTSLPFFTEDGSFWSNCTTELLANSSEGDRQARTRNRCNGEGYESVALIPLRSGDTTFGLLQFNDHRKNRFTRVMIEMFERLAAELAIALSLRKTASALRDSENRYHLLVENQSDLVVELSPDNKLLFVSESYCETFGITEDELLGKPFAPLVHTEDIENTLASLATLDQAPHSARHQERAMTTNGWRWFEWQAKAVLDTNGKLESIVSVGRDINELKIAQIKLEESEERYKQLFLNMYNGVAIWEAVDDGDDFILRDMNDRGTELSMVKREDVINKHARDAFPGIDDMGLLKVLKRVWQTGEQESYDISLYQDHRISGWFENNVYRLPNGQVVAVYANVTARKQVEEALKFGEERLNLALQGGNLGTWDWNIQTGKSVFNDRWAEMLGYEISELDQSMATWESMIHPDDRSRTQELLANHIEGRTQHYTAEYRLRHKSGKWIWIQSQGKVTSSDKQGRAIRACGTHLDITESRRLQEQLRQSQKMEAIGTLAGGIAHDFNNLLQVIQGYSDMMLTDLKPEDPNYMCADEIHKAASRAAQLTRQLLTFSRRDTIFPENIDIALAMTDIAKMLDRLLRENIELQIDIADDLCNIYADQGQVEQVLINLCVNAGDAMPNGGELKIKAHNTTLDTPTKANGLSAIAGNYILVQVSDNGCGIPSEIKEHIFEPFFTTKHPGRGTGLGLSTVYAIVERNHGLIELDSTAQEGTTFSIYLPVSTMPDADSGDKESAYGGPGGNETVLLAEDDDLVRNMAATVLKNAGYTIIAARDGKEAISIVQQRGADIDAALLDVVMPGVNGSEVYKKICDSRKDIPAIFMTGYSYDFLDGGQPPEGSELLEKPFSPSNLLKLLRKVLDSQD